MPASTPISRTKTAAVSRVIDSAAKGYLWAIHGSMTITKAISVIHKLHEKYEIGATPARRITRKSKGLPNAVLVVYWPGGSGDSELVQFVLLATAPLEGEAMHHMERDRLQFLGYELVRRPNDRGRASWTARRPKSAMAELFAELSLYLNQHRTGAVQEFLERLARQPGWSGVREQSKLLIGEAMRRGYKGEVPFLYYLAKTSHGDRLALSANYLESDLDSKW